MSLPLLLLSIALSPMNCLADACELCLLAMSLHLLPHANEQVAELALLWEVWL